MRPSSKDHDRVLNAVTVVIAVVLFLGIALSRHGFAAETDYIRFSKPDLLTFDKVKEDVGFRRTWAQRFGFGFELLSLVPNVPKIVQEPGWTE